MLCYIAVDRRFKGKGISQALVKRAALLCKDVENTVWK